MFISKIEIKNFRLFGPNEFFEIENFNVPDGKTEGSGINVFVGENGIGKTSLLDAISLPMMEYKSESFSIDDMNDIKEPTVINIFSEAPFIVKGTLPNNNFGAVGMSFKAALRTRDPNNYFSSIIVSDQLFIKDNPDKPKDGSPDLRVNVNNPFSGKRFNENDILFLDRNRYNQIKSGSVYPTRFDRMLEDLDFKFIKEMDSGIDINDKISLEVRKTDISNNVLNKTIKDFNDLTGISIKLDFISNYRPFNNAVLVQRKGNGNQIRIGNMGSGYEMLFALIYTSQIVRQTKKQLIILIDEPELHMHPALQKKLIDYILKLSTNAQVFLSTHSSLFINQLCNAKKTKIMILRGEKEVKVMEDRKLPYLSANEINYLAFDLPTQEYHNELYEYLKSLYGETLKYFKFDEEFFVKEKREAKDSPWKGVPNKVSLHTFIRNQIHHPGDNGFPNDKELKESIRRMRTFL